MHLRNCSNIFHLGILSSWLIGHGHKNHHKSSIRKWEDSQTEWHNCFFFISSFFLFLFLFPLPKTFIFNFSAEMIIRYNLAKKNMVSMWTFHHKRHALDFSHRCFRTIRTSRIKFWEEFPISFLGGKTKISVYVESPHHFNIFFWGCTSLYYTYTTGFNRRNDECWILGMRPDKF